MRPTFNSTEKIIRSPICSLAYSLDQQYVFNPANMKVDDLIFAHVNQYRFVLESYEQLEKMFTHLNSAALEKDPETTLTEFDIVSLRLEPQFRHYGHLFITSLKSLLDLFICLLDICQNRIFRPENQLPDFFSYGKSARYPIINVVPEITLELEKLRADKTNWINRVNHLRNRIIHRGYLLKPKIGFKKLESLILESYKGNNYYIGTDEVDISKLCSDFLSQMPVLEETFVSFLTSSQPDYEITHEVSLKYDELINQYNFNQIKVID